VSLADVQQVATGAHDPAVLVIAMPPTPRRLGTTVVTLPVGSIPVHTAAEHVGEHERSVDVDRRRSASP